MRKFVLLLLLIPGALAAQSVGTISPQQCVWHAGDNPAWAASAFDDSGWQPYSTWSPDANTPRIWVRCHATIAPLTSARHPAMQVRLNAALQVFVNGALAGTNGDMATGEFTINRFLTFPLAPDVLASSDTIALRIALRVPASEEVPAGFAELLVGSPQALSDHGAALAMSGALGYLPVAICFGIIGVVGFMLLGLYRTERARIELLLLAILCWLLAILRLSEFCNAALVTMPLLVYHVLIGIGQTLEFFWIWFVFRLAGRRVPWFYRLAMATTLTYSAQLLGGELLTAAASVRITTLYIGTLKYFFLAAIACTTAPAAAFWPWNRVPRNLRAVALSCAAWGFADFLWMTTWEMEVLGWVSQEHAGVARTYLLFLRAATTVGSVLVLLAALFREQRRIAQDRAQLAGEMASAREMQQYLIPEKLPPTPGLNVSSVYFPSREVGGDFFQVLPDPRDGSTLIIVGDVAGKGLKAGMLAALIVGAVRTAFKFTSDPARVLALLNERLQGRGLVTCLALRIDRDGNAELANAGHLPPYSDGKELFLEGSLPLGALPDISFPIQRFRLEAGQSLLFVSDGVVEAQSPTGELFGFDRTAAISTQPAEQIAAAAQAHGQEDDITVLTLTFAPAEVMHA